MQEFTSVLGIIVLWIILSLGSWWLHRLYVHRRQRRKLTLANEAWTRVREAPEIFADIRAAGVPEGARGIEARTNALLSRIRDYGDFFDDVSALRAELSRVLKREDCPPLTEILNIRRDMWATADVLLIEDPEVFGEAFSEPGSYEEFCRDAEDLLFLYGSPLKDDPIALRLALTEEDMQTFVSGVEAEISDERERERFPTWREIVAYPIGWARAAPAAGAWLWQRLQQLGGFALLIASAAAGVFWSVARSLPYAFAFAARRIAGLVTHVPRIRFRFEPLARALSTFGFSFVRMIKRVPGLARASAARVARLRDHRWVAGLAAVLRRASDRVPGQLQESLGRAAEMARDIRSRAANATARARERASGFESGELSLHYDFLIKAHGLRKRYAEILRRTPQLGGKGREFISRLELEKRSERLRLGTAKLRRRARLELVRFLSVLIAALERLRDRLADAPSQPAQANALIASPLQRTFLPPPSAREAGLNFPGGLRAQARTWARGWARAPKRMRNVTEETEETTSAETGDRHAPRGSRNEHESDTVGAETARAKKPKQDEPEKNPHDHTHADPTDAAVRRVRGLFGIKDRPRKSAGTDRHRENRFRSGDPDHQQETRHSARHDNAEPEAKNATEDDTCSAQILPPLRGSPTGRYDSAGEPESESLKSRLSRVNSRYESTESGAEAKEQEGRDNHTSREKTASRAGRWRRWFKRV